MSLEKDDTWNFLYKLKKKFVFPNFPCMERAGNLPGYFEVVVILSNMNHHDDIHDDIRINVNTWSIYTPYTKS